MRKIIVTLTVMILPCLNPAMAAECVFPNSEKEAPLWVCDAPVEGVSVGAVGSMRKSAAGISFAKQMAVTYARVQLTKQIRVQVQNMVKQYAESTSVADSVTMPIADGILVGSRVFRSITGPDGSLYVLVGLDEASLRKLTEAAVKAAFTKKE